MRIVSMQGSHNGQPLAIKAERYDAALLPARYRKGRVAKFKAPTFGEKLRAMKFAREPHALCSTCNIAKVGLRPGHRNCKRCKAATERMHQVVAWMRERGQLTMGYK